MLVSVLVVLLISLPAIRASVGQPRAASDDRRPNVVIVIADDLRWDMLWALPEVRRRIGDPGVTFTNAYVVNPACCPSRTSLLTGRYSHSTGVWRNHGRHGGFGAFDDSSTLATWLNDEGYQTGLFGKYLNGYLNNPYVPPGWDRWMAFTGQRSRQTGNYYDYDLNVDGTIVHRGVGAADYSTDVLADEAVRFVRSATDPFFLYFSAPAPHGPALPAPRHADAFGDLPPWRPASFNEQDLADKPAWLATDDHLDLEQVAKLERLRLRQYQSLLALDEAVGRIVASLKQANELRETILLFVSDNGFLLGEHRLLGKGAAYEESIRVPFVLRYDGMGESAHAFSEPVLNIDVASTIAELVPIPAPDTDGQSLVPLITGSGDWSRSAFLIEHLGPAGPSRLGNGVPTYCAVHTARYVYIEYQYGLHDLYDLREDPDQLHNLARRAPRYLENRLRARLQSLCDPPPPGFDRRS